MVLVRPAVAGLLAGLVLLSGCGDDPAAPAPAPPAKPAAAAPAKAAAGADAPAADAKRAAKRAAEKITLGADDVPGFVHEGSAKRGDMSPAKQLALERFNACVQAPPQDAVLTDSQTDGFTEPETLNSVSSSVDVLKDGAAAEKLHATLVHPEVDSCVSSLLSETFSLESGGTAFVTELVGSKLTMPSRHGVASHARRVAVDVSLPRGQGFTMTMDIVLLRHKSTVTSLTLTAEEPFERGELDRLVDVLSERMAEFAV